MTIPNKVWAHVMEVSFGDVSAKWTTGWQWCVFDARRVRQGAEMVASDLSFEQAVLEAYSVSTREPDQRTRPATKEET